MSGQTAGDWLLDAIGQVRDEYVLEAHENDGVVMTSSSDVDHDGDVAPIVSGEISVRDGNAPAEGAGPGATGMTANEPSESTDVSANEPATADEAAPVSPGPENEVDGDVREQAGLTVMLGGRDKVSHSRSGTNFASVLILLGIAASLSGVFMVFRNSIVDYVSSQMNMFSSDYAAQRGTNPPQHNFDAVSESAEEGTVGSDTPEKGSTSHATTSEKEPSAAVWIATGVAACAFAALLASRGRISRWFKRRTNTDEGTADGDDAPDTSAGGER